MKNQVFVTTSTTLVEYYRFVAVSIILIGPIATLWIKGTAFRWYEFVALLVMTILAVVTFRYMLANVGTYRLAVTKKEIIYEGRGKMQRFPRRAIVGYRIPRWESFEDKNFVMRPIRAERTLVLLGKGEEVLAEIDVSRFSASDIKQVTYELDMQVT